MMEKLLGPKIRESKNIEGVKRFWFNKETKKLKVFGSITNLLSGKFLVDKNFVAKKC